MESFAPLSNVQITRSGFMISMSAPASICAAVTSHGPVADRRIFLGPSACIRTAKALMFKMMSVTSSRTPSIDENSCNTPSICTAVTAAPWSDESKIRRSAFPSVRPKPRSRGSATTLPVFGTSLCEISSFAGLISSCQFFCIIFVFLHPALNRSLGF